MTPTWEELRQRQAKARQPSREQRAQWATEKRLVFHWLSEHAITTALGWTIQDPGPAQRGIEVSNPKAPHTASLRFDKNGQLCGLILSTKVPLITNIHNAVDLARLLRGNNPL